MQFFQTIPAIRGPGPFFHSRPIPPQPYPAPPPSFQLLPVMVVSTAGAPSFTQPLRRLFSPQLTPLAGMVRRWRDDAATRHATGRHRRGARSHPASHPRRLRGRSSRCTSTTSARPLPSGLSRTRDTGVGARNLAFWPAVSRWTLSALRAVVVVATSASFVRALVDLVRKTQTLAAAQRAEDLRKFEALRRSYAHPSSQLSGTRNRSAASYRLRRSEVPVKFIQRVGVRIQRSARRTP